MKTDTVVFDGKVVDRRYHADYHTTFSPPATAHPPAVSKRCRGWLP